MPANPIPPEGTAGVQAAADLAQAVGTAAPNSPAPVDQGESGAALSGAASSGGGVRTDPAATAATTTYATTGTQQPYVDEGPHAPRRGQVQRDHPPEAQAQACDQQPSWRPSRKRASSVPVPGSPATQELTPPRHRIRPPGLQGVRPPAPKAEGTQPAATSGKSEPWSGLHWIAVGSSSTRRPQRHGPREGGE